MLKPEKHSLKLKSGCNLVYHRWHDQDKSRPVLVCIHGLGSNHSRWLELIAQANLDETWDVLVPDLCGFGESLQRKPACMEQWAAQIKELLQQQGISRCVVMGHSFGANIALHLLLQAADQVRALILIDPITKENFTDRMGLFWRLRFLLVAFSFLIYALNRIGLKRKRIPQRSLYQWDIDARHLLAEGRETEMVKKYSSVHLDLKYNTSANYLRACVEVLRPLPKIHSACRTLFIRSKPKTTTPLPESLTGLENLEMIDIACNHWLLTEKPVEVRTCIVKYLQSLE